MDIISFNEAATANGRIEKFIKDPDSNSGVVTVPKTIGSGENVTIPAGRVAVLPNVQVDGTLNIEGEVFIPSGSSYTDIDIESNNAVFDTLKVQGQNVSPFSGFKNYIINGKKVINQRSLTSTDNSYNQDRWYKAGNNWYQGIEGDNNLISGKTYTLSWEGVAIASYYVGTATSATINSQTFTAIGNGESFTLTISSGQNLWIKFASDATGSTFDFVQLEEGSVATPFEQRPYGLELSLCQRYLPCFSGNSTFNTDGVATATNRQYLVGTRFPVEVRVPPTGIVYSDLSNFRIGDAVTINETPTSITFISGGVYSARLYVNGTSTTTSSAGRPATFSGSTGIAKIYFTGCEL